MSLSDLHPPTRWRTWLIVLVTALVGIVVAYSFLNVFGPPLIALALAYVLEPLVAGLHRRGMRRGLAVTFVFLVTIALGTGLVVFVGVQAAKLVQAITQEDGLLQKGAQGLLAVVDDLLGDAVGDEWRAEIAEMQKPENLKQLVRPAANVASGVLSTFASVINVGTFVILVPVYLIYLMLALPRMWGWFKTYLPAQNRDRHERVLSEVHRGLSGFLRGYLVNALLKGSLLACALWIIGTPFGPVVGIVSGFLTIIPFIGALCGWAVAVALTLTEQAELAPVLIVTACYVVAELLEGFVLLPLVMESGVDLHPVTILVSVFFWGAVFGLFGALIAIPLTLIVKALLRAYVLPSVERLASSAAT